MDGPEDGFDLAVIGTGLPESIVAAALARKGFSVLQLDPNPHYGGEWASLSLEELLALPSTSKSSAFIDAEVESQLRRRSRQYALPALPTLLPAASAFVDTLVKSGVSEYVNFHLIEAVGVYEAPGAEDGKGKGKVRRVPTGKEDVFQDPTLSLVDKRRLMKFLMWVASAEDATLTDASPDTLDAFLASAPHSLPLHLRTLVASLSLSSRPIASTPTAPALERLRQTLRSLNRFGASPFLVGQYGGAGEWVGGFARSAAVKGATQVIGRPISRLGKCSEGERWDIVLEGDLAFSAKRVVVAREWGHLMPEAPPQVEATAAVARAIAIVSGPLDLFQTTPSVEGSAAKPLENVLLVFPPDSAGNANPVTALIVGEGALSCPDGERVVCLSTLTTPDADPRSTLTPHLDALITGSTSDEPPRLLFAHFSIHKLFPPLAEVQPQGDPLIMPSLTSDAASVLSVAADWAVRIAEQVVRSMTGDDEVWDRVQAAVAGAEAVDEDDA